MQDSAEWLHAMVHGVGDIGVSRGISGDLDEVSDELHSTQTPR